jgi:isopentenyldiphosphate isomerase
MLWTIAENLMDEAEWPIGTAPKIPAHLEGLRHRALSVIICDPKGLLGVGALPRSSRSVMG